MISSVATRQEKLPTRLSSWPSARNASLSPQFLLGPFALVDVDQQVVPADDVPVRIPKRKSAGLKPAVDAIETSSTYFELEGVT